MTSLYLHIPFCRRKCPYCDFFSTPDASPFFARYPDLLVTHLGQLARCGTHGPFTTVFFGGGTPSLLSATDIARILETVRSGFGLTDAAEISMEINPGTVTPERLRGYRDAGVTRLSLGVQSLHPEFLRTLGRIHSPNEAIRAFEWARVAGFDNLSCDLMFGLPGQSLETLEGDLDRVLGMAPEHLSIYGLTLEEGTPFHHRHSRGELRIADEDLSALMYRRIHERVVQAGYDHYEISNFSRPGYACRHNTAYWERRPYLGVGPGAHSFFAKGWGERYEIPADLQGYATAVQQGQSPFVFLESFDREGALAETLYLGLRQAGGVREEQLRRTFGKGLEALYPQVVKKLEGFLVLEQGRWKMSLSGWLIYDSLISHFL